MQCRFQTLEDFLVAYFNFVSYKQDIENCAFFFNQYNNLESLVHLFIEITGIFSLKFAIFLCFLIVTFLFVPFYLWSSFTYVKGFFFFVVFLTLLVYALFVLLHIATVLIVTADITGFNTVQWILFFFHFPDNDRDLEWFTFILTPT